MNAHSPADRGERDELTRAQSGDRGARARVVERYMDLVRAVAHRYRGLGLPLEDLVQEGAIGLLEAIDRFDCSREAAFTTYAYWRVRQAITHALTNEGRLVRLPKQIVERRRAIAAAATAVANRGEPLSVGALAVEAGLSPSAVREALAAPTSVVSLDEPFTDGTPLEATVADPASSDPEAEALAHTEAGALRDALARLPEHQRLVVTHHFGIGHRPETLETVGEELHVSPQRARAIERAALYRLASEFERPRVESERRLLEKRARRAGSGSGLRRHGRRAFRPS